MVVKIRTETKTEEVHEVFCDICGEHMAEMSSCPICGRDLCREHREPVDEEDQMLLDVGSTMCADCKHAGNTYYAMVEAHREVFCRARDAQVAAWRAECKARVAGETGKAPIGATGSEWEQRRAAQ